MSRQTKLKFHTTKASLKTPHRRMRLTRAIKPSREAKPTREATTTPTEDELLIADLARIAEMEKKATAQGTIHRRSSDNANDGITIISNDRQLCNF